MCMKMEFKISGGGWGCSIMQGIRTGPLVQASFGQIDEKCDEGRKVGGSPGKRYLGRRHNRCKGPEMGGYFRTLVGRHV